MSNETTETTEMGPTKAAPEHAWLHKLVGTFTTTSVMNMGPDQPEATATGEETYSMWGDLWVLGEGTSTMSDGHTMKILNGVGFDVTFNEYRGFYMMDVSSHLWKSTGELSEDGKKITLTCEGPNMMGEGTMMYRDVIELIDDNSRTLTSYGQMPDGSWEKFSQSNYTRKT